MAGIEFLEPASSPRSEHPEPEPPAPSTAPLGAGTVLRSAAAAMLWLGAAALSVVAAFQTTYSVSFASGVDGLRTSVDAWGRISVSQDFGVGPSQHGPRYGIAFCVCAGIFAVLTAYAGVTAVRRSGSLAKLLATGAGVAGAAALGGLLAALDLEVGSALDDARLSLRSQDGLLNSAGPTVTTSTGASLTVGLGALGCAILAAAVFAAWPQRPAAPSSGAEVPLLPWDEELPDNRS